MLDKLLKLSMQRPYNWHNNLTTDAATLQLTQPPPYNWHNLTTAATILQLTQQPFNWYNNRTLTKTSYELQCEMTYRWACAIVTNQINHTTSSQSDQSVLSTWQNSWLSQSAQPCAPSKDFSDLAHLYSLFRVFTRHSWNKQESEVSSSEIHFSKCSLFSGYFRWNLKTALFIHLRGIGTLSGVVTLVKIALSPF